MPMAGAMFLVFGCAVSDQRRDFNLILGLTGVFELITLGSRNSAAIGFITALWRFRVWWPVDSGVFLQFLPASHQFLLAILLIGGAITQVVAILIAWPLLGDLTVSKI
jgi:hypothetical protein